MEIVILEEECNWKNMSLWDFLQEGNIPYMWDDFFTREDIQQFLYNISETLKKEHKLIYPELNNVFRTFIPLQKIKVVLLGMDPYHNGSATGICFSVKYGNKINPSLRNIYKELENEGYTVNKDGNLLHWVNQGCMMLNTALTVREASPDSHTKLWKNFSTELIKYISKNTSKIVWILLGKHAHSFDKLIDKNKNHCILISSHPSPLSAYKSYKEWPPFLQSNIFSRTNDFLHKNGKQKIKW